MMRSARIQRFAATAIAVVLLPLGLPGASALSIIADEGELHREVTQGTSVEAPIVFSVVIRPDETGSAYAKVLPVGSPAYRNGTVNGTGWWTEFRMWQDTGSFTSGATNGSRTVDLGGVEAGVDYAMDILVHVPAQAVADVAEHRLTYIVAVHQDRETNSSGASIDQSASVSAAILVVEAGKPEGAGAPGSRLPTLPISAALGILLISAILMRRSLRRDGD